MYSIRAGDLVRDEFGNVGVVLAVEKFGNGPAANVQFPPGSGYDRDQGWILACLLDVVNEST